jgi:tetratricopeptide (TPR) repeat protein
MPVTLTPSLEQLATDLVRTYQARVAREVNDISGFVEVSDAQVEAVRELISSANVGSIFSLIKAASDLSTGNTEILERQLEGVIGGQPTSILAQRAHRLLGILIAPKDMKSAERHYMRATQLDSGDFLSWYWLGRTRMYLGSSRTAEAAFGELATLSKARGNDLGLARAHEGIGRAQEFRGEYSQAQANFALAQKLLETKRSRNDCNTACERIYSTIIVLSGDVAWKQENFKLAGQIYEQACAVRLNILNNGTYPAQALRELAACTSRVGDTAFKQFNFEEAEHYYRNSLGWADENLLDEPHNPIWLEDKAIALGRLAKSMIAPYNENFLSLRDNPKLFREPISMNEARLILNERLVQLNSSNLRYQAGLAYNQTDLAVLYFIKEEYDKSKKLFNNALNVFRRLCLNEKLSEFDVGQVKKAVEEMRSSGILNGPPASSRCGL